MSSKNVMIARRIRRFRDERAYSQEYMASQLGLSQKGYSRLESGQVSISVERLLEISKLLDKDISEFYSSSDNVVFDGNSVNNGVVIGYFENLYQVNKELLDQLTTAQKTIESLSNQLVALSNELKSKK